MPIHIHLHPTAPPTVYRKKNLNREEWVQSAVSWYRFHYALCDRPERERARITKQLNWLTKNAPEGLGLGVHLLAPEAALMGEDIYIVDGAIQHTLHLCCEKCQKFSILRRREQRHANAEWKFWCAYCNQYTKPGPEPADTEPEPAEPRLLAPQKGVPHNESSF
jgi:hypothetical protein